MSAFSNFNPTKTIEKKLIEVFSCIKCSRECWRRCENCLRLKKSFILEDNYHSRKIRLNGSEAWFKAHWALKVGGEMPVVGFEFLSLFFDRKYVKWVHNNFFSLKCLKFNKIRQWMSSSLFFCLKLEFDWGNARKLPQAEKSLNLRGNNAQ
jgi:hypothetical protein